MLAFTAIPFYNLKTEGLAVEVAAPDAFIVDTRLSPIRSELSNIVEISGDIVEISGDDVAPYLYRRLVPAWREGGFAVSGVTGCDALFCIEQAARAFGLRTIRSTPLGTSNLRGAGEGVPGSLSTQSQELELEIVSWLIAPNAA